ncbi:ATP-binding cassette domain-containing protein [Seohaeicola zhoushanensis]|uniref:ABC transporter ATP-binding protein n=1 Tax=Seohaeicola zhoushanensis TaxID=1569283 RepID=A0A8J3MAH2_9RHOB|nr:ATP-binding cassette domain-containing protein [Seohaeicola zhoushanensis]GHF69542.1 ABC transporter ATP-binding protein [Seohaeicola zhoushanensis]
MRDFMHISPRIEATGLRIGRNGASLLNVAHLVLDGPGPTLILGPNGAGKSLLLRCLHGLIVPDEGRITMEGVPLSTTHRARQAMVFQKPVLLRRSVMANLTYVLRRQGLGWRARRLRAVQLLEEGGLAAKARQSAQSLSGGEAQRLAILRALAIEPEILFLDEPTSALDPSATQAIEGLILAAARRGTRIVMVTHDIGQARRLGADIVLMNGGQVAEQARVGTFFTDPQSAAARRYLAGALVI